MKTSGKVWDCDLKFEKVEREREKKLDQKNPYKGGVETNRIETENIKFIVLDIGGTKIEVIPFFHT